MGMFAWQKNLFHSFETHDAVVIWGNINDVFVYREGRYQYECDIDEMIVRGLHSTLGPAFLFDPYEKASELVIAKADAFTKTPDDSFGRTGFNDTTDQALARIKAEIESSAGRKLFVFKHMHNVMPFRNSYSPEEHMRLAAFHQMLLRMNKGTKFVLQYLSESQVPLEFSGGSPRATLFKVPVPELDERMAFIEKRLPECDCSMKLARATDSFSLTALWSLFELARNHSPGGDIGTLTMPQWREIVSRFKFGENRDYYGQIRLEDLDGAKEFFIDKEGVKGQKEAVNRVVQMLWKARTNVASLSPFIASLID